MLPIVGSRFRPPADTILSNLPGGQALLLRREPENPHDPNAIQVVLPAGWQASLPADGLRELMETVSLTGNPFPSDEEDFHVGFIPRALAADMAPAMDADPGDVACTLGFTPAGAPGADVPKPEGEEDDEEGLDEEV